MEYLSALAILVPPSPGRVGQLKGRAPNTTAGTRSTAAGGLPATRNWRNTTIEPDTGKPTRGTLIETRKEGGYALIEPSPGYQVAQGSLTAIPTLTPEERAILLAAARSFNMAAEPVTAPPPAPQDAATEAAVRPGDAYNERATLSEIADLLARHGWQQTHQRDDVSYWRRPNKDHGWSATLNHIPGKLYVFSSNAAPFVNERAYEPFAIYTLLEHGGDWAAAARALGRAGYGAPLAARRNGQRAARATAATPNSPTESKGAAELLLDPPERPDRPALAPPEFQTSWPGRPGH